MEQAVLIRVRRVDASLPELSQSTQFWRALGVISAHWACALGEAAMASSKSAGTRATGSSPTRMISTVTVSPAEASAAASSAGLNASW